MHSDGFKQYDIVLQMKTSINLEAPADCLARYCTYVSNYIVNGTAS